MLQLPFLSLLFPFTVKLIDSSYDVPTTHSIDPYTGQDITHPGHHVENKSIEVRINNQPFTPYWIQENENNWTINFFYNIRVKGHFADNWAPLYGGSNGYLVQDYDSEYTVVPLSPDYPSGAKVDFQVEALIGYEHGVYTYTPWSAWVITGEESGWSNTQTLTITDSASTSTPNTSPSPSTTPQDTTTPPDISGSETLTVLGLDWVQLAMLTLLAIIAVLLVVVVVYLRKRSTQGNHQR